MVEVMVAVSRERIASRIHSIKYGGGGADIASKLGLLRRLRDDLSAVDSELLVEFLSHILDLLLDGLSPVRKFVTQIIGEIGLKHLELLPEIVPSLIDVLKDDTPAVVRQAISCGLDIFRCSLVKVAIQGAHSSEFNESMRSTWASVLKFRDEIYSIALKVGSDGRRLPALKFVESVVLLYTPDPNGSLEPPSDEVSEGKFEEFNVSWVRGGHPVLNVRDMSAEASKSLGLLLDQLRFPSLKSHSYLVTVVLIKSLSAVATKRPAFYGRILPVLLGLDPSSSAGKVMHLAGVNHALKNAFESCLNCSHPGAAPWRERLVSALKEIKFGKPTEQPANEISENSGKAESMRDSHVAQIHEDEKPSIALVTENSTPNRKRAGVLSTSEFPEDDMVGKRARSTPDNSGSPVNAMSEGQDRVPSSGPTPSGQDADNGPVQQLVAMFGALVAQGEKAVVSLEILISSISADLLAEVVMATMRNLPLESPKSEEDEEHLCNMVDRPDIIGSNTHIKHLSVLLTDVLSQSKSSLMEETETEDPHHSVPNELEACQTQEEEEPRLTLADSSAAYDDLSYASPQATVPVSEPVSPEDIPSAMETDFTVISSEANDIEGVANEIPGLALSTQDDGLPEDATVSSKDLTDLDDADPETFTNLASSLTESDTTPMELAPSVSTDKSEELSPKSAIADTSNMNSSTATSVGLVSQLVLPKLSAPTIYLADEQKDQLQELAFVRIVDAYKQVTVAGGSQVRFSVLAHSGMEGHELTLRVLYRLFGEAEEDRDFFSSTTASSIYETFLLQVAETLRDSFPASDKSLSRLLGEVPYLPKSIFEMLERLCSPGTSDNDDKELHGGDRVTQGLSTVWSLMLLRPPIRDACLRIALKSAVHHLEEVRMKAIRLVANKLYPLPSISKDIEDFAKEMLLLVVSDDEASKKEPDGTHADLLKDQNPSTENKSAGLAANEISPDSHQPSASESIPSSTVAEVQRCMSLYFALCTKKHSLFRVIFDVYKGTSQAAKQAVHRQIPLLVRTIGSSHDLLDLLSDPPSGSEGLVTQVVHTLTDGTVPSPELVSTVKRLYETKIKEVEVLFPILPFLPKDEVLLLFPHLVNAPIDKFQVALSRILQVTDACNACFEQRQIYTQQVLAKVLNQLVEQIPLPLLFMRTVLQAIGAFPSLVEFIMEILSRLVSKQIWKYPKLWVGFMKCALLTKPQSFGVLLQLPTAQLENALNRTPGLKAPLIAHASQPDIRSSLPRSTLVVLGLVSEPPPQTSTQTQPTQPQTEAGGDSEKEAVTTTDKSKESSSAS
ncbi:symplekin [Phtheirospermum japonicum]|uniref:Symplekin n=1 Tax=Phtheirospermum japonicum TaxID=374723 RepID=A0A830BXJ5_9LAMI|nr:symplekin [Phtheirospermum japonicum]